MGAKTAGVEFAVLGPLEVRSDGRAIPIGRGKQRTLLALLVLNAGRVVPAERLIDELWGDDPPATASTALQVYVSRLRKALGGNAIATREPGYVVDVARDAIDLFRFERIVREARAADPERAVELLREALELWRGPPLADVDLRREAERLDELRLDAVEECLELELGFGRHGELVHQLEALVREQPLRERFREQLMLALYRSGRQAEALDAYRDARRALVEELGIEPGERLQQLEQAILRHEPALGADTRPVTATAVFFDLGIVGEIEPIAEPALAAAEQAFRAAGGRVERGVADAVVAIFAGDASAQAAVHAAVAARAKLAEFGSELTPRAGVATGDALLGERVSGAAVVLAARRVRSAGPGEILVGERTAAAVRGTFDLHRRGDSYVLDA
jgi:DNA-binding SARP family transcriptional activator